MFLEPVDLHPREVPVAVVDCLELAAVDGHDSVGEQLQLAAEHHEAAADVANAFAVIAAEVCNGLEVGGEPASQPHQFHVALAFALQPAAGLDAIEIPVQIELQQHRRVIRRPTRCSRLCAIETQADQVQLVDEDVHYPNRVVFCNEVI